MICKHCKKDNSIYHSRRKRTIKTLDGVIQIDVDYYICKSCGKAFTSDNDIAPDRSRYGWDVIELATGLINSGERYENISLKIKKISGFGIALSQLSEFKNKYLKGSL